MLLNDYFKNTISLAESLIIKMDDLGVHINNELINIYGVSALGNDLYHRSKWKYYINLTGEYYKLDEKMYVTLKDNNERVELNKLTLSKNPLTKEALINKDRLYHDLIDEYPHQESLIKSMLFPVELEDALKSTSGDILTYDSRLVENNEIGIIEDVELRLKQHIDRWFVRDYCVVDNLYLPHFLSTLYSHAALSLLNVRLSKTNTHEAHSYHVNKKLKSNFNIEFSNSSINSESKMWLYRNIENLRNITGTNELIDELVSNVLYKNDIDTYILEIKSNDSSVTANDHTIPESKIYLRNLKDNTISALETNSLLPISTKSGISYDKHEYENTMDKIKKNRRSSALSKVILLSGNDDVKYDIVDLTKVALDLWGYLGHNGHYNSKKEMLDTDNGIKYLLSPSEGFCLFMYSASKLINKDISVFNINSIVKVDGDYYHFMDNETTKNNKDTLVELMPEININVRTSDGFYNLYNDVVEFINLAEIEANSGYGESWRITHKDFIKKVSVKDTIVRNEEVLESILNNLKLKDEEYDYLEVMKVLYNMFTGMDLIDNSISNKVNEYKELVDKLTSYTTQVLLVGYDYKYKSNTTVIGPMGEGNYSSIVDGIFNCLEDFHGDIYSELSNFPSNLSSLYDDIKVDVDMSTISNKIQIEYIKEEMRITDEISLWATINRGSFRKHRPVVNADNRGNFKDSLRICDSGDVESSIYEKVNRISIENKNEIHMNEVDLYTSKNTVPLMNKPVIEVSNTIGELQVLDEIHVNVELDDGPDLMVDTMNSEMEINVEPEIFIGVTTKK